MDGVVNSSMYGNGGCSSDHLAHFPSSSSSHILESLWVSNSSQINHDPTMVNFSGVRRPNPSSENDEEEYGSSETEGLRNPYKRPEKKRRLTTEQVKQLEKSFEVETKLEPERKVHLAKELGLQPRQVAIWFQNRRARFKTKQLEKEYDSLKSSYESLQDDFDSLLKEKERLENEVSTITNKLKQDGLQFEDKASSAKSDVSDDSERRHCTRVEVKPEMSEFPPEDEELRRSLTPMMEFGYGDVYDMHGNSSCNMELPSGVEDHSNYWPHWPLY